MLKHIGIGVHKPSIRVAKECIGLPYSGIEIWNAPPLLPRPFLGAHTCTLLDRSRYKGYRSNLSIHVLLIILCCML